jgi:hypothetical protein
MNMFARDRTASGKLYDKQRRYQIVIRVFGSLDDPTATALKMMAKAVVVVHGDLEEAERLQGDFLKVASHVASGGELNCYGMTCIVDTLEAVVHSGHTITGEHVSVKG